MVKGVIKALNSVARVVGSLGDAHHPPHLQVNPFYVLHVISNVKMHELWNRH